MQPDITDLSIQRSVLLAKIESAKAELTNVERAILERIDAVAIFDRHDKTSGEITEKISGRKIKLKIDKRVKWDSAQLLDVAKTMPWAEANRLFKIEFSMGEKEHGALAHRASSSDLEKSLLEKVNEARTVKFSEPKILSIDEE